jgi:hypothetical protein
LNIKPFLPLVEPILSIIFLIIGICFFWKYTKGISKKRGWGSSGIQFGYSGNIEAVTIDDFTFNVQLKRIILRATISHANIGDYCFMFTLPYKVRKILSEEPSGWEFKSTKSGSLLYITYARNMEDVMKLEKIKYVKVHVEVEDEMVTKNYGNYFLYLPFGSGLSEEVSNALDSLHKRPQIASDILKTLRINLTIPSTAIVIQSPHIKRIDYWKYELENQTLTIKIGSLEPIILQYIIPGEISKYQNYLFFSGLFIGTGLSFLPKLIEIILSLLYD